MTFTNYSKRNFQLSRLDDNPFPASAGWVTKPQSTLEALDGQQVMAVSETSTIEETDVSCIWFSPDDSFRFGVRIHIPGQFIPPVGPTMGTAPYYYVGYDNNTNPNPPSFDNWIKQSPSDPYTWSNTSDVNISATTSAGKSSITIDVIIKDQ